MATPDAAGLAAELQASGVGAQLRVEDAAAQLADALPALDHWRATLSVLPEVRPELYDVRRYQDGDFIAACVDGSGFYELHPREASSGRPSRPLCLFYDAARDRWLSGDWYGLRYLALAEGGRRCPAHYNWLSASLAIPEDSRPPELYERALVLCSGRLPERRGPWLYYHDVEPALLTTLAAKLHLSLEDVPNA